MAGNTSKRSKLETQLRAAEVKLAHKRDVARHHESGTAWRTRAEREIEGVERRIADLRKRLAAV
jgi:hypothetical protein